LVIGQAALEAKQKELQNVVYNGEGGGSQTDVEEAMLQVPTAHRDHCTDQSFVEAVRAGTRNPSGSAVVDLLGFRACPPYQQVYGYSYCIETAFQCLLC
jgi:hypothetical protein